jgi:hypothetical protein
MLYVMLGSQGVPEINSELLLKELGLWNPPLQGHYLTWKLNDYIAIKELCLWNLLWLIGCRAQELDGEVTKRIPTQYHREQA